MGLLVRSDPEQLFRVVGNLVRNARQAILATGKGGEICVRAREEETAWIIEVADTGPGLPAKAQEHLFTPFQGGITKGGTGLGLAISAELVRGHGGCLELSETGEGRATIRLHHWPSWLQQGAATTIRRLYELFCPASDRHSTRPTIIFHTPKQGTCSFCWHRVEDGWWHHIFYSCS